MVELSDILNGDDADETGDGSVERPDNESNQIEPNLEDESSDPAPVDNTSRTDRAAPEAGATDSSTDLNGIEARITELETQLTSTDDELQRVQNAQEDVETSLDEITETLDELVGMYDQFMADTNPFVDSETAVVHGGTTDLVQEESTDEQPANIDQPTQRAPTGDTATDSNEQSDRMSASVAGDSDTGSSEEEVVGFEDLVDSDQPATADEQKHEDSNGPVRQQTTPDTSATTQSTAGSRQGADEKKAADGPLLKKIPPQLSAEVLTLEWLSALTAVVGPAGAIQAVRHYEQIGWITPTVRRQVESLLASPSLDVFIDPTNPREPTAKQHQQSYQYIFVLKTLAEG
ncbi:MAG: hypothetical protein J07HX64_02959 [halophilic archaeon J07HX64]|jgi:Archaeal flagella protein./Flagella accessory protein C (FlaC).|nr:MAG: hypothetical protein J07HX64_02959 [halophilic archaeon J07HX64]